MGEAPPTSRGELKTAFDESLSTARSYLLALDDDHASRVWTLVAGPAEIAAHGPGPWRSLLFNHLDHHRGQLLVHLRPVRGRRLTLPRTAAPETSPARRSLGRFLR